MRNMIPRKMVSSRFKHNPIWFYHLYIKKTKGSKWEFYGEYDSADSAIADAQLYRPYDYKIVRKTSHIRYYHEEHNPVCPKCGDDKIKTWHSGGYWKAQCQRCLWHGLEKSLKNPLLETVGAAAVTGVGLGVGFKAVDWATKRFRKNPIRRRKVSRKGLSILPLALVGGLAWLIWRNR